MGTTIQKTGHSIKKPPIISTGGCSAHPGIDPKGEGYLENDPECRACTEAETCLMLTEARNQEKGGTEEMRKRVTQGKSPSTRPIATSHKFMPKSRRGFVFEALSAGTPEDKIVKDLMKKFDYSAELAKRKISAVKKLAGM